MVYLKRKKRKLNLLQNNMNNNGVIYVASLNKQFYNYAVNSATSLKDFSPSINLTLFTHEKFLDDRKKVFDNVITNIPIHHRAKMWCMARSPYNITAYIDSDTECWNTGFEGVFDELEDNDIAFTVSPIYSAGKLKWTVVDVEGKHTLRHQGGFCLYRKNDLVMDFHKTWYEEYLKQYHLPWNLPQYNESGKPWDMFTLWRLCNDPEFSRFKDLKIKEISVKYNYCVNYLPTELKANEEPIMVHFSKSFIDDNNTTYYRKLRDQNIDEKHKFEKSEANQYPPAFN